MNDAAIYAKIKSMRGSGLKTGDYNELLRCRSVGETAGYLKNTPGYGSALRGVSENYIHRGQLENLICSVLAEECERILRFIGAAANEFYRFYAFRREIEQIITLLYCINSGDAGKYAVSMPAYLAGKLSIDLMELAQCDNVYRLAQVLKKTRYSEVVEKISEDSKEAGGILNMPLTEKALITFFYTSVLKNIEKIKNRERKERLSDYFKKQAEVYNITLATRAISAFNMSAREARELLIPVRARLPSDFFDRYLTADPQQRQDILKSTPYYTVWEKYSYNAADGYREIFEYDMAKKIIKTSVCGMEVFAAYITLKENEIRNLIHIVEGVRYGLPREDIEKLLI